MESFDAEFAEEGIPEIKEKLLYANTKVPKLFSTPLKI